MGDLLLERDEAILGGGLRDRFEDVLFWREGGAEAEGLHKLEGRSEELLLCLEGGFDPGGVVVAGDECTEIAGNG